MRERRVRGGIPPALPIAKTRHLLRRILSVSVLSVELIAVDLMASDDKEDQRVEIADEASSCNKHLCRLPQRLPVRVIGSNHHTNRESGRSRRGDLNVCCALGSTLYDVHTRSIIGFRFPTLSFGVPKYFHFEEDRP